MSPHPQMNIDTALIKIPLIHYDELDSSFKSRTTVLLCYFLLGVLFSPLMTHFLAKYTMAENSLMTKEDIYSHLVNNKVNLSWIFETLMVVGLIIISKHTSGKILLDKPKSNV